jgi:hypothetical protein
LAEQHETNEVQSPSTAKVMAHKPVNLLKASEANTRPVTQLKMIESPNKSKVPLHTPKQVTPEQKEHREFSRISPDQLTFKT